MNRARSLALVALLAAGCIPDTKKLDPFASAASSCPVLFDVLTAKLGECQNLAPYLDNVLYANAVRSCGVIAAAEAAGRIGYDRAKMETCVNGLKAPGCAGLTDACADIPYIPKVGVGGTCYNDVECATPAVGCYKTNNCPGTCQAGGGLGARCSDIDPPCGPSYYCDTSSTVAQPSCAARAATSTSCASLPCLATDFCNTVSVCQAKLAAGVICTGYGQCNDAQGLYCDTTAAPFTCKAPVTSTAGGRCDYPNRCAAGLWCDYSPSPAVCRAAPLAAGATCTSSTSGGCSISGLSCISGTCQSPKAEGATCTQGNGECQFGLYCAAGAPSRCVRWPGVGGSCASIAGESISCASGSYCAAGICAANVAPGAVCPSYAACDSTGFGFSRSGCVRIPDPGGGVASTLTCVAACSP